MPNDLVSREAVLAAIVRVVNAVFDFNKGSALDESGEERDIFQREVTEEIKAAIASLPAPRPNASGG